MILVSLHLNVVFERKQLHFTKVGPHLHSHFGLQCLVCGKLHELESPATYRLKPEEKPHYYISQVGTVIKQTRRCTNCGLLSALPDLDEKHLQKALEKVITQEFIEQHSKDEPPVFAQRLFDRTANLLSS